MELKHLAIIMDGNRRWAAEHGKEAYQGHLQGAKKARDCLAACLNAGIPYVSLFAFSKENWSRSQQEVAYLWDIIALQLQETTSFLMSQEVRFIAIGDKNNWPAKSRTILEQLINKTQHFTKMTVLLVLDYSGQWDIDQAVVRAAESGNAPEWKRFLLTSSYPDPDILIRTGCEKRLSNFYLYNLAYTELFFPKVYWPDFTEEYLKEILSQYTKRKRRFGVGVIAS
jgi:undecaprenyl diphosphate synthase